METPNKYSTTGPFFLGAKGMSQPNVPNVLDELALTFGLASVLMFAVSMSALLRPAVAMTSLVVGAAVFVLSVAAAVLNMRATENSRANVHRILVVLCSFCAVASLAAIVSR